MHFRWRHFYRCHCNCHSSFTSAHPDRLQHPEKLCFPGMGPSAPDERDPHWLSPAVPPRYVPAIDDRITGIVVMFFCFFFTNSDCILSSGYNREKNIACERIDAHLLILKTYWKPNDDVLSFLLLPAVLILTSRSHCCTLDPPSAHLGSFLRFSSPLGAFLEPVWVYVSFSTFCYHLSVRRENKSPPPLCPSTVRVNM